MIPINIITTATVQTTQIHGFLLFLIYFTDSKHRANQPIAFAIVCIELTHDGLKSSQPNNLAKNNPTPPIITAANARIFINLPQIALFELLLVVDVEEVVVVLVSFFVPFLVPLFVSVFVAVVVFVAIIIPPNKIIYTGKLKSNILFAKFC